jgi:hypothetical protein
MALEDSARLHPVSTSLDFETVFLFTEQGRQPCAQPPAWSIRPLSIYPPVTGRPPITVAARSKA